MNKSDTFYLKKNSQTCLLVSLSISFLVKIPGEMTPEFLRWKNSFHHEDLQKNGKSIRNDCFIAFGWFWNV